ncbi:hypothetical protein FC093_00720 [Ilyomonas limi]|uniref:Uncharacterized protein n=1 Tax=Ilyomonas limi TaxID=2575867 RepID=A0A4U3L8G4_9BACT|nr:DUF5995 family protein [Ilyomonas limi]TKK71581.1 hypothetical protein FC093_00720 [Ilyomonas limi]
MKLNTIGDVITTIDAVVQDCIATQNTEGYFAALYKRMTIAVSEGISNGAFEDGARMEKLDICFAERYLSAWQCYRQQQPCSASWQCAFDATNNNHLIVLQHLILGINTHINLDLAIAAAAVCPGNAIHALEKDFNNINNIIATLVDDIQSCLEQVWFPMRIINRLANRGEQAVLNFSISVARKAAWSNAVYLAQSSETAQQHYIHQMDTMVRLLAHKIQSPGWLISLLLKAIRAAEYDDVRRTIKLIDTTVVD